MTTADNIKDILDRLDVVEKQLKEQTELTTSVHRLATATAENTKEVVELMVAFRGAFIVMNFIGKGAKPVLWITATMAAIAIAWAEFRGTK